MAKGKQTCKILKEIRKQIAAENDIKLVIEECTYQGDCKGTCPKCEAEVRYLERELEKRQRLGKAAIFAGMTIGTAITAASCGPLISPPNGMMEIRGILLLPRIRLGMIVPKDLSCLRAR